MFISSHSAVGFAVVAFTIVMTPGPNMAYLVSRSICQGKRAGLISLAGVLLAFSLYVVLTCAGLTALLVTIPLAYTTLRFAGALYLGYLAFQTLRPGGRTPFEVANLSPDSARRLFSMGFLTNLLNPKAALLYLSLLPQFVKPALSPVWIQIVQLAVVQILISGLINSLIILSSGAISRKLQKNAALAKRQRLLMGTVLGGLAVKMAFDTRK